MRVQLKEDDLIGDVAYRIRIDWMRNVLNGKPRYFIMDPFTMSNLRLQMSSHGNSVFDPHASPYATLFGLPILVPVTTGKIDEKFIEIIG